jgi:competence protein ComEC
VHEAEVIVGDVVPRNDFPRTDGAGEQISVRTGIGAALTHCLDEERDRWFNWVPVCFGIGIAVYFRLPVEPSIAVVVLVLTVALVLVGLARFGTLAAALCGVIVAAAFGFGVTKARTEWVRAPILERQVMNAEVRGFLELVEPKPTRGQRLTIRVTHFAGLPQDKWPRRVRVRTLVSRDGLKPGDGVRIKATLAAPAEPSQPGAFDFGRQAYFLGLGGIGYAMSAADLDPEAGPQPWQMWVTSVIETVRQRIGRAVVAGLPGETGGIANALITGERGGISAATDSAYRDSGLYHILSISGLHMVVMAGAFFFSVRFVFAAIPAVALRYPIKRWAAVAAALGALGYLLISGSSFATVRSYIMISILFLAIILERPALALRNVALAALLLLVIWPESLFDAGFQMSFGAVVALISGYEAIRAREERLGRAHIERGPVTKFALFFAGITMSTLMATLSVAPFAAYQFHTSQQYGVVANLVALPLCDLIVMPAALATLMAMPFGLEAGPLWIAGLGIDAMTAIAVWVAKLPGAVIPVVAIPTSTFVLLLVGGLWLLLWQRRWRLLGLPFIALGLALSPTLERPDLLIGRDGRLVAARADGTSLTALPAPRNLFELSRWLETDGDARTAKAVAVGERFRCDGAGCSITVKGMVVAIARHASAFNDDCQRAGIVVMDRALPKGCTGPKLALDYRALRAGGAHAVYINKADIRVETVMALRGERPWAPARPASIRTREAIRSQSSAAGAGGSVLTPNARMRQVSASAEAMASHWPRPQDEDDDLPAGFDAERAPANGGLELAPPLADED